VREVASGGANPVPDDDHVDHRGARDDGGTRTSHDRCACPNENRGAEARFDNDATAQHRGGRAAEAGVAIDRSIRSAARAGNPQR
jgi:hypothetical protein